jgi:hypothetical protein
MLETNKARLYKMLYDLTAVECQDHGEFRTKR